MPSGFFFFSSRRRHTRFDCDWSSDVCSSDLLLPAGMKITSYNHLIIMCEGSFLPSSFGPHQKHTEFESSLRSYPIHPSPQCNRQARSSQTPSGLDRTQADRETTLHAPQSGSAWIGGSARAVAWSSFRCISAERQGRCASTIQTYCRCEFVHGRSDRIEIMVDVLGRI